MHGTMTAIKNRKGRKRKSGRRYPSGDIIREKSVDFRGMAGEQPHRSWLPESVRGDERAESVIGCLNLLYRTSGLPNAKRPGLNGRQYNAGRRLAVITGEFRAAIGTPRGTAGGGRGYKCEPTGCLMDSENCICERRIRRFNDCASVLLSVSQKTYNVTYRVAVSDEQCSLEEIVHLKNGLNALAHFFGIDK
jgi:hypothetical protein